MEYLQKVFGFFSKCLAVGTILVIILTHLAFFDSWVLGFLMIGLPVLVILNIMAVVFWAIFNVQQMVFPMLACLCFLTVVSRAYQFRSDAPLHASYDQENAFMVLNYNVSGFSTPFKGNQRGIVRTEMVQWLIDAHADILCMPEYFSHHTRFKVNEILQKEGYQYNLFTNKALNSDKSLILGLGIFSKYPIVNSKEKVFEMQNGLLLADVKIKKDTVRVIAVHLHSMVLSLYTLRNQREWSGLKREGIDTFKRMRDGFVKRGQQNEILEQWIRESPYPVIVCGDFNETPYGYVYGRTRKMLRNAFEEGGHGFGYTFNKLPYFIRIDHQFYDESRLELLDFKTDQSIKYSDHYPLRGTYLIKKPAETTY
jgi:endonuclease/exonuclease/phosphatase family metal-dependent hydrolase